MRVTTQQMTNNWHPVLRSLIAGSDQKSISAVPVLTSIPVKPWQSTNVTLLGDAIHTMTPLQGLGGSSALRDAGVAPVSLSESRYRRCRSPNTTIWSRHFRRSTQSAAHNSHSAMATTARLADPGYPSHEDDG